jgi:hypothetical protein
VSTAVDAVVDNARRRGEAFPHGDDWIALAAVGDNGDLVGQRIADFEIGAPSEYNAVIDQRTQFASLPTEQGEMPLAISGTVDGQATPAEMVVAVNGRIAGVIGGYVPDGSQWTFIGYLADLYSPGRNDVEVYEVRRGDGVVTLRTAG